MRPVGLLFVCTGNVCRSPLAAAVLGRLLEGAGLSGRWRVGSAGLRGIHAGRPADPRACAAAARRGLDLTGHRARRIRARDFVRNQRIVGMGSWHVARLRELGSGAGRCRLSSLPDYAPELGGDEVLDPWPGGEAEFERALDWIEAGCAGLLRALRDGAEPPPDPDAGAGAP